MRMHIATTNLIQTLFASMASALVSSCVPVLPVVGAESRFPIVDSGLVGNPQGQNQPYWIDNSRILYVEQTKEKRTQSNGKEFFARRVVLWDLRTNQITRMHETTGPICYHQGYFHSDLWDWGDTAISPDRYTVTHTYGELDNELKSVQAERSALSFDEVTCRPRSESPKRALPDWTKGKTVWELEEIGGVLVLDGEREKSLRNLPVRFHRRDAPDGIPMPFNSREHQVQGYHAFKGAYFILGTYFVNVPGHPDGGYGKSPWPEGTARPYWWLYPEGKLKKGMLTPSQSPWDSSFLPFRDGIAWHVGFIRGEGLYVFDTSGERLAIEGFVQQVATSPDGCRIAMNHRRSINDRWDTGTLKVIELCQGKRK